MDLQYTQQENAAQLKSLPDRNLQTPHHWYGQKKDQDVENQIADSVPSEERDQVDTVPRNGFIPIPREGGAAEKSQDGAGNPESPNNKTSCPKRRAKECHYSKYPMI